MSTLEAHLILIQVENHMEQSGKYCSSIPCHACNLCLVRDTLERGTPFLKVKHARLIQAEFHLWGLTVQDVQDIFEF